MKKRSIGLRICAIMTAIVLVVGMLPMMIAAEAETWDQNYLITRAVTAGGAPVSAIGNTIEYTMLTGDFFNGGALTQFTTYSTGSPVMLGSEAQPVCVWPWQIKVTAGSDFVVKIKAKQDVYMQLWQDAPTSSTWVNNMQISYVVENAEGTRVTVKTLTETVNVPITTAEYDTHLHMAAGDTAYLIYRMPANTGTYPSNMRITVDAAAYDASLRTDFGTEPENPETTEPEATEPEATEPEATEPEATEPEVTEPEATEPEATEPEAISSVLKHTDMVSAQVAVHGAPVTAGSVTYQYLYGDLAANQLNVFTVFGGNGSGGANDVVGDGVSNNVVWRWQWRAGDAYDTMLRMTATEDLQLSLSHPDPIPEAEIWAFHSTFILYTADEAGTLVKLAEYPIEKPMNTDAVDEVIHMAAGDSIYLVYQIKSYANGQVTAGFMPWFTVNTGAYDASLRTDFYPEPEVTEPEATEPEATEPEATEPEATEPEATEPEATEPEAVSNVLKHTEMVSAQVEAQGAPVTAGSVTYQYLYGDLMDDQLNTFTVFGGNGSGGADDVVGDGTSHNVVWRWQWRAGDVHDTMLRMTATEDLQLSLSHPDTIPEAEIWAFHSTFILYTADETGKLVKLAEYPIEKPMNTDAVDEVIHMAAGDSIYLVYRIKSYGDGQVTAGFMPWFTVDKTGYDASLRTDFAAAPDITEPEPTQPSPTEPEVSGNVLEHPDMVSAQVAAQGQVVSGDTVDYQYLIGDFYTGTLSPFTTFTGAGKGDSGDMLGNTSAANAVWRWQWRCSDKQTVLRMTAKENVAITFSAPAVPQQWAAGTAYYVIAENANGEQALLKTIDVKPDMQMGGSLTVHLAKGAKLYIVYGNSYGVYDAQSPATSDFVPAFTLNTALYNSVKAPGYSGKVARPAVEAPVTGGPADTSQNTDTHEEFFESDLVSEEVQLQGGTITKGLADFQFLVGDFFRGGQLQPFTEFAGTGEYAASDVVGNPDGTNFAYRWQWRTMSYTNTILKVTAKKDICLTVDQREGIAESQWATHTTFAYVVENTDQERLTVHEMKVKTQMDSEYMKFQVHLAAGESLYIVYYIHTGMDGNATAHYNPWIIMDTEAYDESLRTDFSMLEALSNAVTDRTAQLQDLLEQMLGDGNVYSETNAEKLMQIVSDAIAGLGRLATVEAVDKAYEAAVEKMEAVKTLADEAAELADYKERAKKELADSVLEENYSDENWQQIQEIIAKANSDIDAANKAATVSQVLAYAKASIKKIPVEEPTSLMPILLIGGGVLVLAAASVVIIAMKKKKKQA